MSIFINDASKVIVQGMTGSEGTKHTRRMLASGTKVVGGVTPGKGGQVVDIDGHQLPVFNTVAEAMSATGALRACSSSMAITSCARASTAAGKPASLAT